MRKLLPTERARKNEPGALDAGKYAASAPGTRSTTPRPDDTREADDEPVRDREPDGRPEDDARVAVHGVHGPGREHGRVHVEAEQLVLLRVEGAQARVVRDELEARGDEHGRREGDRAGVERAIAIEGVGDGGGVDVGGAEGGAEEGVAVVVGGLEGQ